HARIERWRRAQAVRRTATVRPDLLAGHDVRIRRAKPADAPELADVAAATFLLACPPGFPPEAAEEFIAANLTEERFRAWAKSRRHQVWLAEIAGAVIGYTLVVLDQPGPAGTEPEGRIGDLSKVYVLPEHHGIGVAHRLMDATLAGAARAGMTRLWLGVN